MQKVLFLFGELNDDDIDWMITTGQISKIPAETRLVIEGEPLEYLYILLEGLASVSISVLDTYKEIAQLSSGEIFGELSFIDQRPPTASVETVDESLVLAVPRLLLADRLNQDVGFSSRFYRAISIFLANRLRNTVKYLGQEKDFVFNQSMTTDDLSEIAISNFELAMTRFDWLLRRVKSQTSEE